MSQGGSISRMVRRSLPAILVLSGALAGQSGLVWQGQVVAANDMPVPGVPGAVFGGSGTFDLTVITGDGTVVFRGRMTGGGTTAADDRAIFYGKTAADLAIMVRNSGPVPGLGAGYSLINAAGTVGLGGSPRVSDNGSFAFFGSNISGPGVTTADDTALFGGSLLGPTLLVREGETAPGTMGGVFSSSFSNPSQQPTCLNNSGRALFQSNITGGDVVGTTNNVAWFTGLPGILEQVVRKGENFVSGPLTGYQVASLGFVSQMNTPGQVLHDLKLSTTGMPLAATAADDTVLLIYTPGSGNAMIVREGDPAPGTVGATFNNSLNSWSINTGAHAFNNSAEVIIVADLLNGDVVAGQNDRGVYIAGTSGLNLVIRRGDAAPGTTMGELFYSPNNSSLSLNNLGQVAFQGILEGPGTATTNDTCIYVGTPGNLTMVAREGDVAPGTGGQTYGNLAGLQLLHNNRGQVLFNATLSGTGSSALFSYDPVRGVRRELVVGDMIETSPGILEPVGSFGGVQFTNGDARALSFNDSGDYVLRVNMNVSPARAAIIKGRVGTITAIPTEISTTTGGVQTLFLDAGHSNAGNAYIVAGTASGTTPGFPLGAFNVPLNIDDWFTYTITFPNVFPLGNTLGAMDTEGRAIATLAVPAGITSIAGLTLHHAYGVVDGMGMVTLVSDAAPLLLTL